MNSYVLGNTVRLRATFVDDKDKPLDATQIRCRVLEPGQSTPVTIDVTVEGLGRVFADFIPAVPGIHIYGFDHQDVPITNGEGQFLVTPRAIP